MTEEHVVRLVLAVVLTASGAMLIWMAAATASGRLGRNQLVGIRLASTMASEEAWVVAHRRARRPTAAAGWCAVVAGAAMVLPLPVPAATAVALVGAHVMLVLVAYGAFRGHQAARATAQDVE